MMHQLAKGLLCAVGPTLRREVPHCEVPRCDAPWESEQRLQEGCPSQAGASL